MNGHDGTKTFLEILPRIERHARIAFRFVRDPAHRDDCVREVTALCWKWCCRLAEQGRDARAFPTALATFAALQVRSGRTFVGGKTGRRDALSPHAQAALGFRTQALPSPEGRSSPQWMAALEDNTASPVADQAAFRIDFAAWLQTLTERNRDLAADMMAGETTLGLSARYSLSPGRISQLRRELSDHWRAFTGEA